MNTNIFDELNWRGLIADATDGLFDIPTNESITVYCGFDPTAPSLHVGHLLPLVTLARLQNLGCKPIAVAGDATGRIGDPSGRSSERNLLSAEELEANLIGINQQLAAFLDFENRTNPALILNNSDWLAPLSMLDFMRDTGKFFSVNMMLGKESVKSRLGRETGLSFTEFSYMLLQAYDFLFLHKHFKCNLQIGGTDQWGNILAGRELIQKVSDEVVHGLVMPLVTKADGSKFGKTASGAVWLSAKKTSPYQFHQFWLNTDDRDVISYLKRFTWLGKEEICTLEKSLSRHPEKREAQRTLARVVTTMVHGEAAVAQAEQAANALFVGDLKELSASSIADVFDGVATTEIPASDLQGEGLDLVTLLAKSSLVRSKGEARRSINGGGIYMNDERMSEPQRHISLADVVDGQYIVLRKGRRTYHLVRVVSIPTRSTSSCRATN